MNWLDENEAVRVSMGMNSAALAAVVRPGLLFALQSDVLRLQGSGLTAAPRAVTALKDGPEETVAIQKAALQLGR